MGTLTLTELKTEVRSALANRTDLDTRLTQFLNLSQQRLARLHDFDEMETIASLSIPFNNVDADKFVVLASLRELYSITVLDDSNSRKLAYKTPRQWDKALPKPSYFARNTPAIYTLWSNTIEIYPLPEKAYTATVRMTSWPTAFTTDAQVSDFNQKDDILIEMTVMAILRSLKMYEEAASRWPNLRQLLSEAVLADRKKPDSVIAPLQISQSSNVHGGNYWVDPFIGISP